MSIYLQLSIFVLSRNKSQRLSRNKNVWREQKRMPMFTFVFRAWVDNSFLISHDFNFLIFMSSFQTIALPLGAKYQFRWPVACIHVLILCDGTVDLKNCRKNSKMLGPGFPMWNTWSHVVTARGVAQRWSSGREAWWATHTMWSCHRIKDI